MLYKLLKTKSDLNSLPVYHACLFMHVYLLFLQFIPTTLVANGPLVWEAEQQINSVSLTLHYLLNDVSASLYNLFPRKPPLSPAVHQCNHSAVQATHHQTNCSRAVFNFC